MFIFGLFSLVLEIFNMALSGKLYGKLLFTTRNMWRWKYVNKAAVETFIYSSLQEFIAKNMAKNK